jgi:lipoteichoic acid synthase
VLCGYPRAQSPERAAKSKAPPDVIVVFWESAAAWAVGPHSEPARTPCLSAIPGELTVFDNIRCNAPYTVTSLATFLMGAYAPLVIHNWGVHERPYFLPRVFAGSGFETWSVSCSNMQFSGTRQMMKAFGFDRVVSGEDAPARYDRNLWGVDDRFVFDQLKERLSRPSDRPLFAVALTSSTHYPYQDPLPGFPRIIADPLGRYEQAIAFTDQQIVAFYQFLKGRRGARDFVFLVVGDHGQAFGQHAGAVGHGGALFEENIRVACVMLHPPGELPRRISTTGSILDLGPTVIELAGLPSRPEHQGRSLLGAAPPNVAISYLPVYDVKFSICFDNYKLIADPRTQLYNLYDLRKDPRERVDVSARERARAECLLAYLSRWLKGQEARWRELVTGAE